MTCPYCTHPGTRVVDSRLGEEGAAVRRRRECSGCGERFTTYERVEGVALTVVKRDGSREDWDRQKLLAGLLRAATKRPVTVPELEAVVDSIAATVRGDGGEVPAERIGELALRGLIARDRVAAIRFASVYRRFDGLEEFEEELRRVASEPVPGEGQLPLSGGEVPSGSRARMGTSPRGPKGRRGKGTETRRRDHAERP